MRVLVAGGAGFIGSFIVEEAIKRGYKPIVLVRSSTDLWRIKEVEESTRQSVEVVSYDGYEALKDIVLDTKPDSVINVAADFVKFHRYGDIAPMVQSIIEFQTHLIEASVNAGVSRFITTGTSFEYSPLREKISPFDETFPFDLYGAIKRASEEVLKWYAYEYGIKVRVLRPFFVYGYRDNPHKLLTAIILADRDKVFNVTPGMQHLDYIYVKDVATAYIATLAEVQRSTQLYDVFNIGSGSVITVKDLVLKLLSLLPSPPQVHFGGRDYGEKEIMWLCADISYTIDRLRWFPSYSIEDGLREMVDYYINKKGE